MWSILHEHPYYMHCGTGFSAAVARGAPIWNLGQAGTLPLTIIMALIIHPRPPCITQHNTHSCTPSCMSVRPSRGGGLGRADGKRWVVVQKLPHARAPRLICRSRSLICDVDTHADNLVVGYFPGSILGLFRVPTKAALGLWVFVSI